MPSFGESSPAGFVQQLTWLSVAVRLAIASATACGIAALAQWLLLRMAGRSEGEHWTERARAVSPLRGAGLSLIAMLVPLAAWFTLHYALGGSRAQGWLAIAVLAILIRLLWSLKLRFDARIGPLPRPQRPVREMLAVAVIFAPWLLVAPVIVAIGVGKSPAGFWFGVLGSLMLAAATAFGGLILALRWCGVLRPARAAVVAAVERAAARLQCSTPPTFELTWNMANAAAVPMLGWVFFTTRAIEHLSAEALEAIAAHEIEHLLEPRQVRVTRALANVVWLPILLAFLMLERTGQALYLLGGALIAATLALGYAAYSRKLELRADAGAHAASPGVYAAALEELYRLNGIPVVLRAGGTHPSLYDRMLALGHPPSYPRPQAPARGPVIVTWLTLPLLLLAFVMAFEFTARSLPPSVRSSDIGLYVAASLDGGEVGEESVLRHLMERNRPDQALALAKPSAERSGTHDERAAVALHAAAKGHCRTAWELASRIEEETPRERMLERVDRLCED